MMKTLARVPPSTWVVLGLLAVALIWRGALPRHRDDGHGHRIGLHGGSVAALGDDHHAELIVEDDGGLNVFILSRDERRVVPIERQSPRAYLHCEGSGEAIVMRLEPAPQGLDPPGMTSRFTAEVPTRLRGVLAAVTLPEVWVDGRTYRVRLEVDRPRDETVMPAGLGDDEARKLYLAPGGIYTAADIKANGGLTAAQKYRGFRSEHDFAPRPGDLICPITRTKANPQCVWIVGGKRYTFCCPPCIDEFVMRAKTTPEKILDEYRMPGE
jgi:hypothetical protein